MAIYICVDMLIVYILEAAYTAIHLQKMRFTGTIFSGIVVPSLLVLVVLLGMNRAMRGIVKKECSLQCRLGCAMAAAFLTALIHLGFELNEIGLGPGTHGINGMISLLVIVGLFMLWLVHKLRS